MKFKRKKKTTLRPPSEKNSPQPSKPILNLQKNNLEAVGGSTSIEEVFENIQEFNIPEFSMKWQVERNTFNIILNPEKFNFNAPKLKKLYENLADLIHDFYVKEKNIEYENDYSKEKFNQLNISTPDLEGEE